MRPCSLSRERAFVRGKPVRAVRRCHASAKGGGISSRVWDPAGRKLLTPIPHARRRFAVVIREARCASWSSQTVVERHVEVLADAAAAISTGNAIGELGSTGRPRIADAIQAQPGSVARAIVCPWLTGARLALLLAVFAFAGSCPTGSTGTAILLAGFARRMGCFNLGYCGQPQASERTHAQSTQHLTTRFAPFHQPRQRIELRTVHAFLSLNPRTLRVLC
jgi:hypothetical protein